MNEAGFDFNEGADALLFNGYQCRVDGDEILVADVRRQGDVIAITDRDESEYDSAFPAKDMLKGKFGSKLRIFEVGAGLSSFAPKAVAYRVVEEYVVCDPVDYHAIDALLDGVPKYFHLSRGARAHLRELQTSVAIYTNPRLITHIPLTIEQAFASGQVGQGYDAVLNMFATGMYFSRVSDADMQSLLVQPPRKGTEGLHGYHMF